MTVATVTLSPSSSTNSTVPVAVTLTCGTAHAVIYYTTDGSPPTAASIKYTGTPIMLNSTTTVQAIAILANYNNSAVAVGDFTFIAPAVAQVKISPNGGTNLYTPATVKEVGRSLSGRFLE